MQRRRIVITGIGGLCSLGTNAAAIWEAMREGRSGIGPLTTVPLEDLKNTIGAEIKELPHHDIDRKQVATMDRFALLAAIAAGEAMKSAGLTIGEAQEFRAGAVVGTGIYGGYSRKARAASVF
jgi:nodulation protein E